jgi:ATP-dependent RNA helicase RhlE
MPGKHSSYGGQSRPRTQNRSDIHRNGSNFRGSSSHSSGSSRNRGGFGRGTGSGWKGGSRGGFRGGGRNFQGGKFGGVFMDISKFVNKAVITEEMPDFKPEHLFKDFAVDERIKSNIAKKKYVIPTPIQDRAIPHILQGKDLAGTANTGTGKTAAFLVPLIDKILKNRDEKILIMVPTRELAKQIDGELRGFAQMLSIFSVCCVGGTSLGRQLGMLRKTNNFIIGTPGRLKDLVERKAIDLSKFNTVVLDEADRMLDMGFIHDMRYMMALLPKVRQTLFFSATMSREIEVLVKEFLHEPVTISVKTGDTAKGVEQDIVRVGARNKIDVLHDLLTQADFTKVLIFGKTKHGVERLKENLVARGFKSDSIHGNKKQSGRQKALDLFKLNHVKVLVATDVAARGIDINDISHVINYDLPATYDDYIHRIGRTGRAGKKGKAITFIE